MTCGGQGATPAQTPWGPQRACLPVSLEAQRFSNREGVSPIGADADRVGFPHRRRRE